MAIRAGLLAVGAQLLQLTTQGGPSRRLEARGVPACWTPRTPPGGAGLGPELYQPLGKIGQLLAHVHVGVLVHGA